MFIEMQNNTIIVTVNDAVKAPVESTLTETGLDLTAAYDCMIWIDSASGEITATTYHGGEMIPLRIIATYSEKEALNHFAESLYN